MSGICSKILQQTHTETKGGENRDLLMGMWGVHKLSSLILYMIENFYNKDISFQKPFIWGEKKKKNRKEKVIWKAQPGLLIA